MPLNGSRTPSTELFALVKCEHVQFSWPKSGSEVSLSTEENRDCNVAECLYRSSVFGTRICEWKEWLFVPKFRTPTALQNYSSIFFTIIITVTMKQKKNKRIKVTRFSFFKKKTSEIECEIIFFSWQSDCRLTICLPTWIVNQNFKIEVHKKFRKS